MRPVRAGSVCVLTAVMLHLTGAAVVTQSAPPQFGAHALTIAPGTSDDLRVLDGEVMRLQRDGSLRLLRERADSLIDGRMHERLAQYHNGLPVFGAEVTRQRANGITISMLGTVYRNLTLDTVPGLTAEQARAVMLAQPDAEAVIAEPELLVLPLDEGGFALAYRVVTRFPNDILVTFVDAHNGAQLMQFSDLHTQVGTGRGVLGDGKKISTDQAGGAFRTNDTLRPPAIETFDLKGNVTRTNDVLARRVTLGPSDLATDADNDWTDGAVVDGHVYAGWSYDYFAQQFNRRGIDDNNLPVRTIIHPISRDNFSAAVFNQNSAFFTNAFWSGTLRLMVYGVGLPPGWRLGGQAWDHVSGALDVVAHELTHGVTQFSSNLIYRGESGALNEAFSDMMGTGAEFFFDSVRRRGANYLIGEDVVTPGGIRSMANPEAYGDPDHYSRRYLQAGDNFGVHINSGIPNQAFYLAIEGGTNRTSGLSVDGVGAANRQQIERVMYRAFTSMLPANANFYLARLATIQSARDLYGAGSPAERAITQAWNAVGVTQQAARITFLFVPDPVPAAAPGRCSLQAPNFIFTVAAAEVSGVPFNVGASEIRFYTAGGVLSSAQPFNFAQLFNACSAGSNRIPAIGLPCASLCVTLGGAPGGFVEFALNGADDLGNRATFVSPRLRLGSAAASSEAPVNGSFVSIGQ